MIRIGDDLFVHPRTFRVMRALLRAPTSRRELIEVPKPLVGVVVVPSPLIEPDFDRYREWLMFWRGDASELLR